MPKMGSSGQMKPMGGKHPGYVPSVKSESTGGKSPKSQAYSVPGKNRNSEYGKK